MSEKTEISSDLVGYFLALFGLFLGVLFLMLQGEWGWLRYVSLVPLTFGFLGLAVQLSEDKNNNAAVFSVGLNFFAWSYIFGNAESLIGQLFLTILLALALSILTVGILMSLKSSSNDENKLDKKSMGYYIFRVVEFIIALGVLVSFFETIIKLF